MMNLKLMLAIHSCPVQCCGTDPRPPFFDIDTDFLQALQHRCSNIVYDVIYINKVVVIFIYLVVRSHIYYIYNTNNPIDYSLKKERKTYRDLREIRTIDSIHFTFYNPYLMGRYLWQPLFKLFCPYMPHTCRSYYQQWPRILLYRQKKIYVYPFSENKTSQIHQQLTL